MFGAVAVALAGLTPAWVAAPAPVAAAKHPTGGVIAWGDDSRGQTDVPTAALSGVAGIVAGCNHNMALKSDGTIVAWGDNSFGQTYVPALPGGWKWTNIGAGMNHSVGVARSKHAVDIYIWGDDSHGQQDVMPSDSDSVSYVDWHDIADVEAGGFATIARMGDGTVRVWGTPAAVKKVPAGLSGVVGMSMGRSHAIVVKSNGTVVAWGDNSSGQTKVPSGLKGVKAVAAGGYHSLALLSNGQVVGWGANDAGQSSPPPRPNSKYIWVAAGLKHSLAVGQLSPDAPKGVVATPWDGAATISWSAPDPGSAPITQYTVTAAPTGQTCTAVNALSCTIGGLTNGVPYTFSVTATNSIGMGPPAASLPTSPTVPALVTPEPAAPASSPTPEPAPAGNSNSGRGGGLPLPLVIAIAAMIGLGVAALAYSPWLVVERAGELVARLRGGPSSAAAGPAGPAVVEPAEEWSPSDSDVWPPEDAEQSGAASSSEQSAAPRQTTKRKPE